MAALIWGPRFVKRASEFCANNENEHRVRISSMRNDLN